MSSKSQLRQDPVSGDWIVLSPDRAKRPHSFSELTTKRKKSARSTCPFEDPQKNGNQEPVLAYPSRQKWAIQVLENKYPAFTHGEKCGLLSKVGPFSVLPGDGRHDLIITAGHDKNFPDLSPEEADLVFKTFRDRYLMLYSDKCVDYIAIFQNWGPLAGASIYHPHYQLLAVPVVPPDVQHSLTGSARYFKENKKCVHCVMIDWEKKEKTRVIFENDGAVALAPYVSRSAFEVRIFPKKHLPYFENTYDQDLASVTEVLRHVLGKFKQNLSDPDYNFFIHTSPLKDKEQYDHYHWHLEVYPRFSTRAGFELATSIEINDYDPDFVAKTLRA